MKQTAESILREYIQFEDVNQSKTIEILPLTIIDAMDEYANQQERSYSEEEVLDLLCSCPYEFTDNIKEWFEQFKKK
jgi:hypothetical protein